MLERIAQLAYSGRYQESKTLCEKLVSENNTDVMSRFCLARLKVACGEWLEGLDLFESVRGHGVFGGDYLGDNPPLWQGQSLNGRRIAVLSEGGLGDAVCFARFCQNLNDLGAEVILATHPEAFPLFRTLPSHPLLVDIKSIASVDFDYWLPSLSAPLRLGLQHNAIAGAPFLRCPIAAHEKWKNIFEGDRRPKIGLVWQGNPGFAEDDYRSFPGEWLEPLLKHDRFRFVSLHSRSPKNGWAHAQVEDFGHLVKDPSDLAGFCRELDLLISVDTGPAHLAGALGVPTILLNRIFGWFTFAVNCAPGLQNTPWYNSMLILNQSQLREWRPEIAWLSDNLEKLFDSRLDQRHLDPIYHPENPRPSRERLRLVETYVGEVLTMPNDFYVGRALEFYGEYSMKEIEVLREVIKPGDVVLDVGAHIGALSLEFAKLVGASGQVMAFEPQAHLRNILELNKQLHGLTWLEVRAEGLSDKTELRKFVAPDYQRVGNFGAVELGATEVSLSDSDATAAGPGATIQLIRLDDLKLDKVDFIKMDVEGMELQALAGARETILKYKPKMCIEIDRDENRQEIISLLKSWGYETKECVTKLFNPNNFNLVKENIYGNAASYNLLAVCKPV